MSTISSWTHHPSLIIHQLPLEAGDLRARHNSKISDSCERPNFCPVKERPPIQGPNGNSTWMTSKMYVSTGYTSNPSLPIHAERTNGPNKRMAPWIFPLVPSCRFPWFQGSDPTTQRIARICTCRLYHLTLVRSGWRSQRQITLLTSSILQTVRIFLTAIASICKRLHHVLNGFFR